MLTECERLNLESNVVRALIAVKELALDDALSLRRQATLSFQCKHVLLFLMTGAIDINLVCEFGLRERFNVQSDRIRRFIAHGFFSVKGAISLSP